MLSLIVSWHRVNLVDEKSMPSFSPFPSLFLTPSMTPVGSRIRWARVAALVGRRGRVGALVGRGGARVGAVVGRAGVGALVRGAHRGVRLGVVARGVVAGPRVVAELAGLLPVLAARVELGGGAVGALLLDGLVVLAHAVARGLVVVLGDAGAVRLHGVARAAGPGRPPPAPEEQAGYRADQEGRDGDADPEADLEPLAVVVVVAVACQCRLGNRRGRVGGAGARTRGGADAGGAAVRVCAVAGLRTLRPVRVRRFRSAVGQTAVVVDEDAIPFAAALLVIVAAERAIRTNRHPRK